MSTRVFEKLLTEDLNLGTGAATKTNPGGGMLTGTQIGIHSFAVGVMAVEETWDPGVVASGSQESKYVSVPGATLGDFVLCSFSLDIQDLLLTAAVTDTNTVTAVLANLTGDPVDMASGTLRVIVFKSR